MHWFFIGWRFNNGQGGINRNLLENEVSSPGDYRNDCDLIFLTDCVTESADPCDDWDSLEPYTDDYGCCRAFIEPHNTKIGKKKKKNIFWIFSS